MSRFDLRSLPLTSIGSALFFVWSLVILLTYGTAFLRDPDTFWHIRSGEWILAHGAVPTVDSYSYTMAGQPWIAKEWLSQVILAVTYDVGGWHAVILLSACAVAVAGVLLCRFLLDYLRYPYAAGITAVSLVIASPHFLARPHILSFPVMVLYFTVLIRAVDRKDDPPFVLLPLMALWANLHGGFSLGIVLSGFLSLQAMVEVGSARRLRSILLYGGFMAGLLLASLVHPYGAEPLLMTKRLLDLGPGLTMLSEWTAFNAQENGIHAAYFELLILLALWSGARIPLLRITPVMVLVHLMLKHVRGIPIFALLAPAFLAGPLAGQFPFIAARPSPGGEPGSARVRAATWAAAAVLAALAGFGFVALVKDPQNETTKIVPREALEAARAAGLTGKVLNDYGYGGYLIFEGVKTFVDGRAELFGRAFLDRWRKATDLNGPETLPALADAYGADWTIHPAGSVAAHQFRMDPGWRLVHKDDVAVVYARQPKSAPGTAEAGKVTEAK
ncbi:hypothetical protein [Prosthecomicrobium sp. N25]|uniref:hypothetical protein n=1 Tax=Prosthecomicrobium sp. N25 TaxID=3129254 RepID=UPI0030782625